MAGKVRETSTQGGDQEEPSGGSLGGAERGAGQTARATAASKQAERAGAATSPGREPTGRRSASLELPFVSAQFRAPDWHLPEWRLPNRGDLDAATRGARSMLPSRKSMLFLGGLAVTAVAGVIEWPVAAAIGVGSALAARGGEGSGSSERAGSESGSAAGTRA